MRQRKLKDLDGRLAGVSELLVEHGTVEPGAYREAFEKNPDTPLFLEVGCGKGGFLLQIAEREPDHLFLGAEANRSVLAQAAEKIQEAGFANVRFLPGYLNEPAAVFAENELDGIYLNFSDPWPKARHEKRRLTSQGFLTAYETITKPGGFLAFKTDNDELFAFSMEQIREKGYHIDAYSEDLHHSPFAENNLVTEYEAKFSARGKSINYVKVIF